MQFLNSALFQRGIRKFRRWQSYATRNLLLPLGRDLHPDRWIFIVGCFNSGTTLLARILAQHPLIGELPGEGVHFTDSLPYEEQYGWQRLWIRCLDEMRLHPDAVPPERIRRIKKQWSLFFPKDTPNLLDDSPINVTRMPFLQANFQPAYFVAMVRNGYAVAEGIRRKAVPSPNTPEFSGSYPLEMCAEQWKACDELVTEDCDKLDHFIQISYEDLTADPIAVAKEITDFLGLPPLESDVFHGSWAIHEANETIRNMNSKSFSALTEADFELIESVARESLDRHGYERPSMECQDSLVSAPARSHRRR